VDCENRMVLCPSAEGGGCKWYGRLSQIWHHLNHSERCTRVVESLQEKGETFRGSYNHFLQGNVSIFDISKDLFWRPLLFKSMNDLIFLTLKRSKVGCWYLQFKAFIPQSRLNKLSARISISKSILHEPYDYNAPTFTFECRVMSFNCSDQMEINARCLHLSDFMIKSLTTPRSFFNFKVDFSVNDKDFIRPISFVQHDKRQEIQPIILSPTSTSTSTSTSEALSTPEPSLSQVLFASILETPLRNH
jgi:hypothetical protein